MVLASEEKPVSSPLVSSLHGREFADLSNAIDCVSADSLSCQHLSVNPIGNKVQTKINQIDKSRQQALLQKQKVGRLKGKSSRFDSLPCQAPPS